MFTLSLLDVFRDIVSTTHVTKDYNADFKQAVHDLLVMNSQRVQLETKIARQTKRVAALYELVQADGDGPALSGLVDGISDACRVVLRAAAGKPMSPAEVRDAVQGLGLPPQANLLASVHTTLKRLKDAGEVTEINHGAGVAYRWVEGRMLTLASLLGSPLDPSLLPEEVRGVIQGPSADDPVRKLAKGMRVRKPTKNPAFYKD